MKACAKCGLQKELSDFYTKQPKKEPTVAYYSSCKSCTAIEAKRYRHDNREKLLAYERERSKSETRIIYKKEYNRSQKGKEAQQKFKKSDKGKKAAARQMDRWRERNPLQAKVYKEVGMAVKHGILNRMPCQICGNEKSEGHHEDYSKALEVIWYCRKHHKERHDQLREMGAVWDVNGQIIFPSKDRPDTNECTLLDGVIDGFSS
jgi:hypothetical protein